MRVVGVGWSVKMSVTLNAVDKGMGGSEEIAI